MTDQERKALLDRLAGLSSGHIDKMKVNLETIINQDERFQELAKSIGTAQKSISSMGKATTEYNRNISIWLQDIKKDSALVRQYRTEFETEIEKSRVMVGEMHTALSSLAKVIIDNLNE